MVNCADTGRGRKLNRPPRLCLDVCFEMDTLALCTWRSIDLNSKATSVALEICIARVYRTTVWSSLTGISISFVSRAPDMIGSPTHGGGSWFFGCSGIWVGTGFICVGSAKLAKEAGVIVDVEPRHENDGSAKRNISDLATVIFLNGERAPI